MCVCVWTHTQNPNIESLNKQINNNDEKKRLKPYNQKSRLDLSIFPLTNGLFWYGVFYVCVCISVVYEEEEPWWWRIYARKKNHKSTLKSRNALVSFSLYFHCQSTFLSNRVVHRGFFFIFFFCHSNEWMNEWRKKNLQDKR